MAGERREGKGGDMEPSATGPVALGAAESVPSYTIEYRENDRRLSVEPMPDPFVTATVHVRGWRNALKVLLRRYTVTAIVSADRETVERVFELNPDYLGARGSERREAWNAQLQHALERFADQLPDDGPQAPSDRRSSIPESGGPGV